jgi:hypothetical protein
MGFCKDCRHWAEHDNLRWGECELAASHEDEPDEPRTKAYARGDIEGWWAHLWTAADYGCVQFEEKT